MTKKLPPRATFFATPENWFAVCGMDVWVHSGHEWLCVKNPIAKDLVFKVCDMIDEYGDGEPALPSDLMTHLVGDRDGVP